VLNLTDNCVLDANAGQADSDGDGYGDACAVSHCVSTSTEFQTALNAAWLNGMNNIIKLVQGTYGISGNGGSVFSYWSSEPYALIIRGGYTAGCAARVLDPSNTVLDGEGAGKVLSLAAYSLSRFAGLAVEGVKVQNALHSSAGAVYMTSEYGYVSLSEVVIENGTTTSSAGGLSAYSDRGTVSLEGSHILGNAAYSSGGVDIETNAGDIVMRNNIIAGNAVDSYGAGAHVSTYSGNVRLVNNTITGNAANGDWGFAGGLYLELLGFTGVAEVHNNIIWGNTASSGGDITVENWAGVTVNGFNNDAGQVQINGVEPNERENFSADPLFVNSAGGDYRLSFGSPCIDAGDDTAPGLPAVDWLSLY
jgi:hypothetical protein